MKIYNTRALTRNQRFTNALLVGIAASILCGIVLGYVLRFLPITFEIFYLGVGYVVGYAIRTYGRGVQPRFSILGAVLTLVAILMADCVRFAGIFGILNIDVWMFAVMSNIYSLSSMSGIINLIFRICAVVVGYEQSRIV